MDEVRNLLEQALKAAVARLRSQGETAAIEARPGTVWASGQFADAVDGMQASESREVGLLTCGLLMERVKRLLAALDQMSEGAYGTCVECGDVISAARLHTMPEVQTCVRCQHGIERAGRQLEWSRREVVMAREDEAMATIEALGRPAYLPGEGDRDVRVPGALRAAVSF